MADNLNVKDGFGANAVLRASDDGGGVLTPHHNLDRIAGGASIDIGGVSDGMYSGSGNGSVIALGKAQVANLQQIAINTANTAAQIANLSIGSGSDANGAAQTLNVAIQVANGNILAVNTNALLANVSVQTANSNALLTNTNAQVANVAAIIQLLSTNNNNLTTNTNVQVANVATLVSNNNVLTVNTNVQVANVAAQVVLYTSNTNALIANTNLLVSNNAAQVANVALLVANTNTRLGATNDVAWDGASNTASINSIEKFIAQRLNVMVTDFVSNTTAATVAAAIDLLRSGNTDLTPKYAVINASSNGTNQIVAPVAGKEIVVLSYVLIPSGNVTMQFQSNTANVSGPFVNKGAAPGYVPVGHFKTGANSALNLNLSSAVNVGGHITYVEK